jgi:hypothetical protein
LAIGDGEESRKGGLSGGKEGAMRIGDVERLEFIFFLLFSGGNKGGKMAKNGRGREEERGE